MVFVIVFIIGLIHIVMSASINWNEVLKKEARGLNDADFGEVQEVSNGLVLTQRGIINKEIFSIPQSVVESYDGNILRFSISEDEAINKYKKNFSESNDGDNLNANKEFEESSSLSEAPKMDKVIDDAVDDSVKEAIIPPTEEELAVENKIERELAAITKEPDTETRTIESQVTHEEETPIEEVSPKTSQNETTQKSTRTRVNEEASLKKDEAGIS